MEHKQQENKEALTDEPPESALEEPPSSGCMVKDAPVTVDSRRYPVSSVEALGRYLPLDDQKKKQLKLVARKYHLLITPYYLSLINPHDPADPIRRQCVPDAAELVNCVDEAEDPLAEEKNSPTPFIVHRYPDRALLLVTGRCFMYCRHCTRKRLWKEKAAEPNLSQIAEALEYVKHTPRIREIIVSGGDPLTLPSERLDYILAAVRAIAHVEVIRIGTRAPVVNPQRIDRTLCKILEKYENLWINVQFNHPREVTPQAAEACRRLQRCGIPLNNQAVLLKGVNDDAAIMRQLMHKLQCIRVRPYYLYQCDAVVGARHFRTSVYKGMQILEQLRGHTGGLCVPTFVVDGPEGKGKIPLMPNYLLSLGADSVRLRNYNNEVFEYKNPSD